MSLESLKLQLQMDELNRLFCFATHSLHLVLHSSVQTRTGITWLDKHTLNLMDGGLVALSVHMCPKRVTQHSLANT